MIIFEEIHNSWDKDTFRYQVFKEVEKNLQLLNKDYQIQLFYSNKFVCIIKIFSPKEHIEIEILKNYLEIRTNSFEFTRFLDCQDFIKKYRLLISAFFKGEYKIINHLSKHNNREIYELKWNDPCLNEFNKIERKVRFFKRKIQLVSREKGVMLIDYDA